MASAAQSRYDRSPGIGSTTTRQVLLPSRWSGEIRHSDGPLRLSLSNGALDKVSTHTSPPGVFDYATYFKSKENLVPESRTRKSATEKQKLKAQQAAKPKKIKPPASRRWVPPTFIAVGLFGVAWLITFYVAGTYIPFMDALGNWNILIGMGGMAAAFAIATLWR